MLSLRFKSEQIFHVFCNCRRNFSCSRWLSLTHYDVLNIKSSSSQKEIRDAYIKLCKENHPDFNEKDPSLHKKFLRIKEAYEILSKPRSRQMYDASIAYLSRERKIRSTFVKDHYETEAYNRSMGDPSFYHNRKEEFMNAEPVPEDRYYGIKGIKRLSNGTLFIILLSLSLISGFIQIITIKNSMMANEYRQLTEENTRILQELRKRNDTLSDDERLEDIEQSYNKNLLTLDPNYAKKHTTN